MKKLLQNQNGFTLLEIIIALAIFTVIAASAASLVSVKNNYQKQNTSKVICVEGFKFVQKTNQDLTQILNDKGSGIKCDR